MKKSIIIILTILTFVGTSPAQLLNEVSKVGTSAAQFLKIDVGARSIGMGGAYVAVVNDATATYWNPAALATLKRHSVSINHTNWFDGIRYENIALAIRLDHSSTIGAHIASLSMDDMQVRTVDEPEGTGDFFSAGDWAMGLSYGRQLTDRFAIGFTVKYIQQKIWNMSASSYGLDFGTYFRSPFNDMRIAIAVSNFGNKLHYEGVGLRVTHDIAPDQTGNNESIQADLYTDGWPLPLLFRAGVAMDIIKSDANILTLAVQANHPNDNKEDVNIGCNYTFNNMFSIRAGYKSLFLEDSEEGLTFGFGLNYHFLNNMSFCFDYAYADFNHLENIHRFSMGMEF